MDEWWKKLGEKPLWAVAIVLVIATLSFGGGAYVGFDIGFERNASGGRTSVFAAGNALPPAGVDFSPLWRAWHLLDQKFVPTSKTDPVSDEELLWGAIQGLADAYGDPYTVFFPPEDASLFEEEINGNFEGVGMEIGIRDDILTVIAPLKGTPAERAGIQSGDQIFKIDEQITDKLTVDEAVRLIRGERGTTVTLTINREGENELLAIDVVREVIAIPTIDASLRADGIFVIEVHNFSAVSANLFRDALRQFVRSGSDKLIVDLRGNPGGFLQAAIEMASWFLPSGKVVVTENFGENDEPRVHRSRGYNIFSNALKMVILVDRGSASASEILAGTLQEHDIATVIGEETFGKGSVQELVRLTDNTSLKITIARWLTPNGNSISEGGLTPDIIVPRTREDFEAERDPQLTRAVEFLLNGS